MPDSKLPVGLENKKELAKKILPKPEKGNAEEEALHFYLQRFVDAKDARNLPTKYFDGLDFITDFETNENAKNTYLRPKKNDSEVRVDVGAVEKKMEAIQNELLTMNLQHEIRAYDMDDLEIQELGEDVGDIVTRTNQIEKDEDFWIDAIQDLLSQRAVFVREQFVRRELKRGKHVEQRAEKQLISSLKVFLGDITIPMIKMREQPYIMIYERMHYERAKALYGHLEEFEKVKPGAPMLQAEDNATLSNYRAGELAENEVEIITYESLPDDEYQVIINSVMMYEPKTTLPWEWPDYDIKGFITKSLSSEFAYGRPLVSSAKVLNALSSEFIRMFIRKTQQSIAPPLATTKGKIYSRDIWDPGAITKGVKASDIEKLVDHNGVNNSEFAMLKLIDQKVEEFIGASAIAQGVQGSREMSATETLQMMKQFLKQLGLTILAISRMKRDLTELRIFNVFENYTNPKKKRVNPLTKEVEEVYRSFTIDNTKLGDGKFGKKIINFTDKDMNDNELQDLYKFEEGERMRGKSVRVKNINVKTLKNFPVIWHIVVNTQEKEGTALDKVIFQDRLNQGAAISKISGRPLDGDRIIEDFERSWKAKNWFQRKPTQENMMPGEEGGQGGPEELLKDIDALAGQTVGEQVSGGLQRATTRPDVKSLQSNV